MPSYKAKRAALEAKAELGRILDGLIKKEGELSARIYLTRKGGLASMASIQNSLSRVFFL